MRLLALAVALAYPASAFAYGEAKDGRPNLEERLVVVLTNQVRQAPHDWPGWDTSLATPEARPPVFGEDGLFEAARFHSDDMATNDHFAHESSDGTPPATRIARYFSGPSGENIYAAIAGDPRNAIDAWMNSDEGHRENLLLASWTHLGAGRGAAGSLIYFTQDFGERRDRPTDRIPAGSVEVLGTKLRLIANFYDPSGQAPSSFSAALGDDCITLEAVAGEKGNQTFSAMVDAPLTCVPLGFVTIDGLSDLTRYPSNGALMVGAGCSADFDPDAAATGCGASGKPGSDRPVIDAEEPGCTCTGPAAPASPPWAFALILLLGALRLRRR